MDEKTLRNFLVQQPRGTRILVRTEDEDVHDIAPPNGRGTTWASVTRSIQALSWVLVELHDSDGKLIRATRASGDGPTDAPLASANLPVLHTDPETARLTHFANLLFRATEFSTTLAFTKMVELFQLQADRAIALESRLERAEASYRRTMNDRIEEAFEQAQEIRQEAEAGNQDAALQLLHGFLGGMRSGGRPPSGSNGPKTPNGVGT